MKASLDKARARRIWLRAQRLDDVEPFGSGPTATQAAVEHLGYVQIDTINVIERSHHHILYSRIPRYRRADLQVVQSRDKSVFEYWTHALSYVPMRDFRYFVGEMRQWKRAPNRKFASVKKADLRKVLRLIEKDGPISIRDITDDVLVEKNHPWASRKPSKKALQLGFYSGDLVISERVGMLKRYELAHRHFGWSLELKPRSASDSEVIAYKLDRALKSQGIVSLDSICHRDARSKPRIRRLIEARVKRGELIEIDIEDVPQEAHWCKPECMEDACEIGPEITHLLSPFDPLVIQRKRLSAFFDYEYRFEAYLPKEQRVLGYFALPVLVGDRVVAAIDLKADRARQELLVQKWTWVGRSRSSAVKCLIEEQLHRFEAFQLDA